MAPKDVVLNCKSLCPTQDFPVLNKMTCEKIFGPFKLQSDHCDCQQTEDLITEKPISARTYLTTEDCWKSSFDGQFFWHEGLYPPSYWAEDDRAALACEK